MNRRIFLRKSLRRLLGLAGGAALATGPLARAGQERAAGRALPARGLTLFLGGDVMIGRGIDQALPHPGDPTLYEQHVRNALSYVQLAEKVSGPIARPVSFDYPWGDALAELNSLAPALRLVNLETAVTAGGEPWPGKGINYRVHPRNLPCLAALGVDACALANNHVLDWGYGGLEDTLREVRAAGISTAGAGRDLDEARAPAVFSTPAGRVLFFSACTGYSGVPRDWAAAEQRAGVNLVDLTDRSVDAIARQVEALKRAGDVAVLSLHWGGNWGYTLHEDHLRFAHRLVDAAGIDLLHGHSSHHPLGIEIYRRKLILYGCGDFFNDYEGITGKNDGYRSELTLMYFPSLDPANGELLRLELTPLRIRRFRLQHASAEEAGWLAATLDRESRKVGTRVELRVDGRLEVFPL